MLIKREFINKIDFHIIVTFNNNLKNTGPILKILIIQMATKKLVFINKVGEIMR